jgi:hypothetical protein
VDSEVVALREEAKVSKLKLKLSKLSKSCNPSSGAFGNVPELGFLLCPFPFSKSGKTRSEESASVSGNGESSTLIPLQSLFFPSTTIRYYATMLKTANSSILSACFFSRFGPKHDEPWSSMNEQSLHD